MLTLKCLTTIFNDICPVLECPSLEFELDKDSKNGTLMVKYTVKTKELFMPFVRNYRQELLLVLSPRDEFKPHMDSRKNSKGLKGKAIQTLSWSENEYNQSQSVKLEVDSKYQPILRIFGKQEKLNPLDDGLNNSTDTYITLDCVQKRIDTYIWTCRNGQKIDSSSICNLRTDCDDGSDEDAELCRGKETFLLLFCRYLLISLGLLGFINYSFTLLLTEKTNENDDSNTKLMEEEMKETFLGVLSTCQRVQNTDSVMENDTEPDLTELEEMFKE